MSALQGVGVLVTRPAQQATPLCRLLEAEGAITHRLAAVDIKACGAHGALAVAVGPLEHFDLIILTSANAVRFGTFLLDQKRDLPLAAIGPATARALNQAGHRVTVQAEQTFDSEALLAHSRLEHVSGRRILLIKGSGGRQLLQQELRRRGAELVIADVYERAATHPPEAVLSALQERFAAGELQVITATSAEIAANLLAMAPPPLREWFARARWLVASERIAASLRNAGFAPKCVVASSAEDQDLLTALLRWRATESGA